MIAPPLMPPTATFMMRNIGDAGTLLVVEPLGDAR